MDSRRFDGLARGVASRSSRRALCRLAGIGVFGAALARVGLDQAAAACGKVQKPCRKKGSCCGSLKCGKPTTRHTCSSSIPKHGKWCCVKPGGRCTECDCCGNYYCSGDGKCIPNPEG